MYDIIFISLYCFCSSSFFNHYTSPSPSSSASLISISICIFISYHHLYLLSSSSSLISISISICIFFIYYLLLLYLLSSSSLSIILFFKHQSIQRHFHIFLITADTASEIWRKIKEIEVEYEEKVVKKHYNEEVVGV